MYLLPDGSDQSESVPQAPRDLSLNKANCMSSLSINNAELSTSAYALRKFSTKKIACGNGHVEKIYDANQHGVEDAEVIVEVAIQNASSFMQQQNCTRLI